MGRSNIVVATFYNRRVRGHIVGVTATEYVVDVVAADQRFLKEFGYDYPCIVVPKTAVATSS